MSEQAPTTTDTQHLRSNREEVREAYERARESAQEGGKADSTLKTYEEEFKRFVQWCEAEGCEYLPAEPETVATYLDFVRAKKNLTYPTLKKKASALSHYHELAGYNTPVEDTAVSRYLKNQRKNDEGRHKEKSAPLLRPQLEATLEAIDNSEESSTTTASRDKAMLMVGWICGMRRSEIASIRYSDLERRDPDGYVVTLRRQKNTRREMEKGIPRHSIMEGYSISPAEALDDWLAELQGQSILDDDAAIFRSVGRWGHIRDQLTGRGVAYALKQRFRQAGLDTEKYTAHSLRSGLATEGSRQGASVSDILGITGHKNVRGVQPYLRSGKIFDNGVFEALRV